MSASPRVSVIIPTFDRSRYIREAIDSVLQQTFTDFELIVVDDGSTDDTRAVVADYGDRVRYVFTPNGGIASARNVGMTLARGEYLTFLDSDDLLYPYMLELESKLLDRYSDVGMVYAEMSAFDDDGFFEEYHLKTYHESAYRDHTLSYDNIFDAHETLGEVGVLPPDLSFENTGMLKRKVYCGAIFDWYLTNVGVFQNNMLVRRSVIERVGPRNRRVKYFEELDLILRITRRYRVCFVDIPTYKLRYHPGQISTTARSDGRHVWFTKQKELLRVIKRHAFSNQSYYSRNRKRLDQHLARLHRAVAVPLLLCDERFSDPGAYARRARMYLAMSNRYGKSEHALWLLTFVPLTARRFGFWGLEQARSGVRRLWPAQFRGR